MFASIIQVCTGLFAWISLKDIDSNTPPSFFKPKLMTTNLLSSMEHLYVLITFQPKRQPTSLLFIKAALPSEATDEQHYCFQTFLGDFPVLNQNDIWMMFTQVCQDKRKAQIIKISKM